MGASPLCNCPLPFQKDSDKLSPQDYLGNAPPTSRTGPHEASSFTGTSPRIPRKLQLLTAKCTCTDKHLA